ncbi:MAG: hypothetical protein C0490_00745, partial [Marivirga sp.]|nr:hypothetical protein [Marivirga sp.]
MKGKYKNIAITLLAALTITTSLAKSPMKPKLEDLPPELAELNFKVLPKIKGVSRTFAHLDR